ncbi:MAG: TRAP transporter fused permease subunit [Desulfobacterales bacterium]|jgi:TRAP transporter 4TM/12TM fusion protein|nr:TRAP transporter fused permease subunit [Desulfobacterales bacterium]
MRQLTLPWKIPILAVAVIAGVFHYYCSGFGSPEPRTFRGLHLSMLLPFVFLLYPAGARSPQRRPSVLDLLAALLCLVAALYTVVYADRLNQRFIGFHAVRPEEVVLGGLLAIAVVEACRRSISKWFAATVVLVLAYLLTCQHWPGLFHYRAFTLDRAIEILYLPNDEGMFGFLMGISADILYIYILFAAVLIKTGAGDYLIEFASWAAGWSRGGAAKISVVSSAFYGTVSGSTVANVYATGSFTIPMMKRSGYTPKQAAAIESVSGVGGQIMPPIMGAGSFIMSEVTGIPYFTIIKVAVIPAVLYYLGVFCMVHFIALKRGIQAIDRADRPPLRRLFRRSYFFLPFLIVVSLLAYGYSPSKAAFHTIWVTLLLSFLDRATWLTPKKLLDTLFGAMVNCALIAAVLAGSGMVVGILTRTGVALAFGSILVSVSLNSLLLTLIFVFIVISVLGTGIPTTPAYIIAVTVGSYALSKFGVTPLAAHLFVFYYAVLADLTPPDAVTSFAAANIAGAEPMATGIEGFKLGLAGFLVPFAFVFQPALLLQGSWVEVAISVSLTSLGVISLAAGVIGYLLAPLNALQRLLLLCAAGLLVFSAQAVEIAGLAVVLGVGLWSFFDRRAGRLCRAAADLQG